MKHWHLFLAFAAVLAIVMWTTSAIAEDGSSSGLTLSASSLTFKATVNGAAPPPQSLTVSASRRTTFTARASSSGSTLEGGWLRISPYGTLTTNQTLTVSVNQTGMVAGTYNGAISLTANGVTRTVPVALTLTSGGSTLTITPSSLSFSGTAGGSNPASQTLSVTAATATNFTASASVQSGSTNWLSISPSGSLTTNRNLTVSASLAGLTAGTYNGTISIVSGGTTRTVGVTLAVNTATSGGGTTFKLIGWNDLGMHCFDGADYSIFGVLPPYNTIHAHLIDSSGALINSSTSSGYTITYQAINDPLTNTLNTSSIGKTNFWTFAAALGFPGLSPDVGLTGFRMPGSGNVPQSMTFSTADNTWVATGIPITPFADSSTGTYSRNYFPMMRLVAKNSSGTVVATQDIVVPTSDEMTCAKCHSSTSGYAAAMPASGWVNASNPAQDVKLNILRKHDDRFATSPTFQAAAGAAGYSTSGLYATVSTKPIFCDNCHASNALSKAGYPGVPALTVSMHGLHSGVTDPATGQTMNSGTTRDTCYSCHPGPKTQCMRGVMASLTTSTGTHEIECQSCHGPMNNLASTTRQGWLDMPNCQACHVGTAISNGGTVIYTSAFSSGSTFRTTTDTTFATNPNVPATGYSLYRFSSGHGGLQCEACHGSTHGEFDTSVVNDNVMSTNLQGHSGMLAECTACHASMPSTTNGGPHGLHPIGPTWVNNHPSVADNNQTACQPCHGTDYRGTILSKTLADRTLAGRSFPKGTIISCYSCHNGPNGG